MGLFTSEKRSEILQLRLTKTQREFLRKRVEAMKAEGEANANESDVIREALEFWATHAPEALQLSEGSGGKGVGGVTKRPRAS